jgi:hypothetical protein
MEAKDAGRVLLMLTSVADPGCLSRILIFFHPGRGAEKISFNFFCSYKFHKIEIIYF